MLTVTLPSGKSYTYRDAARARALADRTGGTLSYGDRPMRTWDVRPGATICVHGDDALHCERGACDEVY